MSGYAAVLLAAGYAGACLVAPERLCCVGHPTETAIVAHLVPRRAAVPVSMGCPRSRCRGMHVRRLDRHAQAARGRAWMARRRPSAPCSGTSEPLVRVCNSGSEGFVVCWLAGLREVSPGSGYRGRPAALDRLAGYVYRGPSRGTLEMRARGLNCWLAGLREQVHRLPVGADTGDGHVASVAHYPASALTPGDHS